MSLLPPLNFAKWVEDHAAELTPPVGNKLLYGDGEFKVMVVGGPNRRTDYHVEDGPEFFYQVKGDMLLKTVQPREAQGALSHASSGGWARDAVDFVDVHIREGEMFMLPPGIPHNPCRFADTVGLVVERERREGELDHLRWYCMNGGEGNEETRCGAIVNDETFFCTDLGSQLKPVIEAYYASEEKRTCPKCGTVQAIPQ